MGRGGERWWVFVPRLIKVSRQGVYKRGGTFHGGHKSFGEALPFAGALTLNRYREAPRGGAAGRGEPRQNREGS